MAEQEQSFPEFRAWLDLHKEVLPTIASAATHLGVAKSTLTDLLSGKAKMSPNPTTLARLYAATGLPEVDPRLIPIRYVPIKGTYELRNVRVAWTDNQWLEWAQAQNIPLDGQGSPVIIQPQPATKSVVSSAPRFTRTAPSKIQRLDEDSADTVLGLVDRLQNLLPKGMKVTIKGKAERHA